MYYYQHSPTCFGAYYAVFRGNFRSVTKQFTNSFEHMIKVLLEDGVISAETCRTVLIIIYVFYCIRAFCWYIKDIITMELCQHRRVKVFSYSWLSIPFYRSHYPHALFAQLALLIPYFTCRQIYIYLLQISTTVTRQSAAQRHKLR